MKVKDLRAFAASVLLDSGNSLTEAALLLRHSDKKTTERHYARAMQERALDRAHGVVAIAGLRLEVEQGLQMAGESGIDGGEQVDGPAVIVTLVMPAEARAADDIGRGDPRMNGQGCAGIGDIARFVRELEDRRVGLRELLGLPPSSTDHCGCACTSARRHVYLFLPWRGLFSAEASH